MQKRQITERLMEKIEPIPFSGCWIWTGYTDSKMGYGMIWDAPTMKLAHRVSYEIHNGAIPNGLHVLHRCDVPCCVNPSHLFVGTNAENVIDKVSKGRAESMPGEKHPSHLLTDKQVLEKRPEESLSQRKLAMLYGVDRSTIGYIKKKVLWKHLP